MIQQKSTWTQRVWDAWCIVSIIGIWPRFIEPRLINLTHLSLAIPRLPKELEGLKILQFSDLHWSNNFSFIFKKKLIHKINRLQPDLIVFTGDFLNRSRLEDPQGLEKLLSSLKARLGCFAVLGNHDYDRFVTVNGQGDYDIDQPSSSSDISKGFKRLFSSIRPSKVITPAAKQVQLHKELIQLLKKTQFQLVHNTTISVSYRNSFINICGLGEYSAGQAKLKEAFEGYDRNYPGIILVHNPDTVPQLASYPGEIVLCGHTHGGQVNLPGMWKKFTCMEYPEFKQGLKKQGKRWIYVNRGIGSVMCFRWFSPPELTFITLEKE